ncbi:MAG: hypothetical protein IPJ86_03200 [Bacteroidetes bacterium]|nr:hypothetical protein [Bacteroidota bacterium]
MWQISPGLPGGTGSVENVTPVASPTQYIVTLNDGICTATDTVNVNWFTTLPAPIGYDSTHCGNQQALCDVSTVPVLLLTVGTLLLPVEHQFKIFLIPIYFKTLP